MATADRKMTIKEVCAELADETGRPLSRSTFYAWRAKGTGPKCSRIPNGELRILKSEFDRWFESLTEEVP